MINLQDAYLFHLVIRYLEKKGYATFKGDKWNLKL